MPLLNSKKIMDLMFFSETSVFQAISDATENRVDINIILDIDNLELKEIEFIDVVRKI